jgi:hypothetical protein
MVSPDFRNSVPDFGRITNRVPVSFPQAQGYKPVIVYGTYYFHDDWGTGTYFLESVPAGFFWQNITYYKVYVDKQNNEVMRVEISYAEYHAMEAEAERLYGYMGWFGFVPGTLRKSLPVVIYPPNYL